MIVKSFYLKEDLHYDGFHTPTPKCTLIAYVKKNL